MAAAAAGRRTASAFPRLRADPRLRRRHLQRVAAPATRPVSRRRLDHDCTGRLQRSARVRLHAPDRHNNFNVVYVPPKEVRRRPRESSVEWNNGVCRLPRHQPVQRGRTRHHPESGRAEISRPWRPPGRGRPTCSPRGCPRPTSLVSSRSPTRWSLTRHTAWLIGGKQALKRTGEPGRPRQVDRRRLAMVERALEKGRRPMGSDRSADSGRVAEVIEETTGVKYHPGHVWKVLRRMGGAGTGGAKRPSANRRGHRAWVNERWPS